MRKFWAESNCAIAEFPDRGSLLNQNEGIINYQVTYFEYKDETGNDCTTMTLAEGEEKTCTDKII